MKRFPAIPSVLFSINVMRVWFVGVLHAVAFHTINEVHAQEITWRLDYRRGIDAPPNCPDENYLRIALAAKNGARDPFSKDASRKIAIDLMPTTERMEARIQALDEHGKLISESIAHAPAWRCDQLADRIVFVLRDIVDPVSLPVPAPSSPVPPSPTPPSPPLLPEIPNTKTVKAVDLDQPKGKLSEIPSSKIRLALSLGIGATWWSAPSTAFSSVLGLGVRWSGFSVGIEGRYDRAWELALAQRVQGEQVAMAIVACGSHTFKPDRFYLQGCLHGDLSRLSTETDQITLVANATTIANFGARLGVGLSLNRSWKIELHTDGVVVVQQPRFEFNDGEQWRLPRFNGALRLNLVGLFDVFGATE